VNLDRVDKVLISLGLARSRNHALRLIEKGLVSFNGKVIKKASQKVSEEGLVLTSPEEDYVGRGAYKLIGALDSFGINPEDLICADMGASTGGFTDVLLKRGAKKVYAVDVGHDQLAESLKTNAQVANMEGVNIRNGVELSEKVDLVVGDLSFISLKLLLEEIFKTMKEQAVALLLIKPQFEVGKENIDKNGLVKDKEKHIDAIKAVDRRARELGFAIDGLIVSPIKGKTGNVEYMALFQREIQLKNTHELNIESVVRGES
jgi:23S rRNA (cytidine1920-2'-O)/16S rRNA (cytidine1409-2'-O)-methyltransferase